VCAEAFPSGCSPVVSSPMCEDFLYVIKGAPPARQPSGQPGRIGRSEREVIGEGCVTGRPSATRHKAGERWATLRPWGGGLPRPDGREPYGRGAAHRSAGPHPQPVVQAVTLSPMTASAQSDQAVLRAGHPLAEQRSPSRARPRARR
jgi:hypothetical protein